MTAALKLARRNSPRKAPTQDRAKATVDVILRAAAHILRTAGYEALNTNAVAKRAGVSIGSLYQYFPSKEALLLALAEQHSNEMSALILKTVEQTQGAPIEKAVETFIHSMMEVHEVDPNLHRALSEHVPRLGGWGTLKELTWPGAQLVRAWLEANAAQFRPLDLDLATFVLVTAVEAVTHISVLDERALDQKALARELTQLVLRYLGAPEETPKRGRR